MSGSADAAALEAARSSGYARGARILSVGIAATGVFTFAYFAVATHVLDASDYGAISLLWSILFVTIIVIYRPVEQLLSRTIADARARGIHEHPLRTPATIQLAFAALFLVVALALRGPLIEDAFTAPRRCSGSSSARRSPTRARTSRAAGSPATSGSASTAGSCCSSRCRASASRSRSRSGIASRPDRGRAGHRRGAAGVAARPAVGAPPPRRRHARRGRRRARAAASPSPSRRSSSPSRRCATIGVLLIPDAALRGVVFSALLIARAPLQLFQAVQTSLLPHLAEVRRPRAPTATARSA